jgi:hypothetical protein
MKVIDRQINALSKDVFEGESASYLHNEYRMVSTDLLSSFDLIHHFAQSMLKIAEDFEKADRKTFGDGLLAGGLGGIIAGFVRKLFPNWPFEWPSWWTGKNGEVYSMDGNNHASNSVDPVSDSGTTDAALNHEDPYNIQYEGETPAKGMDSIYGKPGQLPLDAPVKSDITNRSVNRYKDVINQFGVGNNPRYVRDAHTYCNTFAGDVARAMGVPLPQKREFGMNPKDKATIGFPQLYEYFTDGDAPVRASEDGWQTLEKTTEDLSMLETHVNSGKMAVVVNDGHIAVIKPGQEITDFSTIEIAQAGATCSNKITLKEGFGNTTEPRIYIID